MDKIAKSCRTLLEEMHARRAATPAAKPSRSEMFTFAGQGDKDVYNITSPFLWNGKTYLLGRVESRSNELSESVFFEQKDNVWHPDPAIAPYAHLQDPCITFIDGQLLFGGVRFPIECRDGSRGWRMDFYLGDSPQTLRPVFSGPEKMKDVRFRQLPGGKVAVLTRPQGEKGGRGKIGYVLADSLRAITPGLIENAPVYQHHFLKEEWGGCNEAHLVDENHLGILGHIASFDTQENRHYYPMVFTIDLRTGESSDIRIIAERKDFPDGPSKRPDLVDVIFSGGLIRRPEGRAVLYAGLGDAAAAWLEIEDPFA